MQVLNVFEPRLWRIQHRIKCLRHNFVMPPTLHHQGLRSLQEGRNLIVTAVLIILPPSQFARAPALPVLVAALGTSAILDFARNSLRCTRKPVDIAIVGAGPLVWHVNWLLHAWVWLRLSFSRPMTPHGPLQMGGHRNDCGPSGIS